MGTKSSAADRFVPVLVWESHWQFEQACDLLAAEGIAHERFNEGSWDLSMLFVQPVYVRVRAADLVRARELLAANIGKGVLARH